MNRIRRTILASAALGLCIAAPLWAADATTSPRATGSRRYTLRPRSMFEMASLQVC